MRKCVCVGMISFGIICVNWESPSPDLWTVQVTSESENLPPSIEGWVDADGAKCFNSSLDKDLFINIRSQEKEGLEDAIEILRTLTGE